MKKIISILCAAALVLSLAACGNTDAGTTTGGKQEDTEYSNSTVTGQVTNIDDSQVTLTLGELTEREAPGQPGQDGQAPSDG